MILALLGADKRASSSKELPPEYLEMKFCERFNLSPLEYAQLPRKKISRWWMMASIEASAGSQKKPGGKK